MEQAYVMDTKNASTSWADALSKEMENVRMAFEVLPGGKFVPTGDQFVQCHMGFNIKMENLR